MNNRPRITMVVDSQTPTEAVNVLQMIINNIWSYPADKFDRVNLKIEVEPVEKEKKINIEGFITPPAFPPMFPGFKAGAAPIKPLTQHGNHKKIVANGEPAIPEKELIENIGANLRRLAKEIISIEQFTGHNKVEPQPGKTSKDKKTEYAASGDPVEPEDRKGYRRKPYTLPEF